MNFALILAGGSGVRLGGNIPKQYQKVQDIPLFVYCLKKFQTHPLIDGIFIVAAKAWQTFIQEWIVKEKLDKFKGFAEAGTSRQESIYYGLTAAKQSGINDDAIVVVHDIVRPCVSEELISDCILALKDADGVMPVIPVKDTIYQSKDSKTISNLLNRDELFAGQAPESFRFGKYYEAHQKMLPEQINTIRGSSEIACLNGLRIRLIPGSEDNYKITTQNDLDKFRNQIAGGQL